MTPGHLDIMAKGKMISDGNPLKQPSSACEASSGENAGKGYGRGLQSHVNKTTVEIGVCFQMPRGEILVFRCDSVDLESGGQEFFVCCIIVFEFIEKPAQWLARDPSASHGHTYSRMMTLRGSTVL